MYSSRASVTRFQSATGIAIGAALTGAGLMFLLDPRSGRRRRALLMDQVDRGWKDGREFAKKVRVDAANRTRGLYHQSRSALRRGATDDERLVERIRSALGRLSAHPGAIEVSC